MRNAWPATRNQVINHMDRGNARGLGPGTGAAAARPWPAPLRSWPRPRASPAAGPRDLAASTGALVSACRRRRHGWARRHLCRCRCWQAPVPHIVYCNVIASAEHRRDRRYPLENVRVRFTCALTEGLASAACTAVCAAGCPPADPRFGFFARMRSFSAAAWRCHSALCWCNSSSRSRMSCGITSEVWQGHVRNHTAWAGS